MAYVAHFGAGTTEFFGAACRWPMRSGSALPASVLGILKAQRQVDFALRLDTAAPSQTLAVLTADTADAIHETLLLLNAGEAAHRPQVPQSASEYNEFVSLADVGPQLRTNFRGYRTAHGALACDFRLLSYWLSQRSSDGVRYQITLRALTQDSERTRRSRKYLAWLDIDKPFTEPVRQVQRTLVQRLLSGGWLADEALIFKNGDQRLAWEAGLRDYFAGTSGLIGFRDAPIETYDCADWLTTGCHSARDPGVPEEVNVEAASVFTDDEVAWICSRKLDQPDGPRSTKSPVLFISYASSDFSTADSLRAALEAGGWPCWIAPRDINYANLPYTEAITAAIGQVRLVVVLLSSPANLSVHIPRELDLALERRIGIIPVRLENVPPAGQLNYLLRTCQWLDAFGRPFDQVLTELRQRLQTALS